MKVSAQPPSMESMQADRLAYREFKKRPPEDSLTAWNDNGFFHINFSVFMALLWNIISEFEETGEPIHIEELKYVLHQHGLRRDVIKTFNTMVDRGHLNWNGDNTLRTGRPV